MILREEHDEKIEQSDLFMEKMDVDEKEDDEDDKVKKNNIRHFKNNKDENDDNNDDKKNDIDDNNDAILNNEYLDDDNAYDENIFNINEQKLDNDDDEDADIQCDLIYFMTVKTLFDNAVLKTLNGCQNLTDFLVELTELNVAHVDRKWTRNVGLDWKTNAQIISDITSLKKCKSIQLLDVGIRNKQEVWVVCIYKRRLKLKSICFPYFQNEEIVATLNVQRQLLGHVISTNSIITSDKNLFDVSTFKDY